MRKKVVKSSLIRKTILLIVCLAIAISTFAIVIYTKGLYDVIISQYKPYSIDITKLVASEIDAAKLSNIQKEVVDIYNQSANKVMSDQWGTPEFEAYLSQFKHIEETDDYKSIHADLQKMQDEIDVDCLYIPWIDVENECYLYLVDAAHDEPCPVGCIDPVFFDDKSLLNDLSVGMHPNITNTPEYGWLISTAAPIYNSEGDIIAMAAVDISMNDAMSQLVHFMIYIEIAFMIVILLVCILAIFLINKFIVKPINTLSKAASSYKNNKVAFSELNLNRNDEIGLLADSMIQMEKDIDGYINDIVLAREHAHQMDRAANIDALTGVGNKRAYDMEVERLNKSKDPYCIVLIDMNDLKGINDNYGHEKDDISIKTVCHIICRVFDPSSVYRIGGDEFVVILEDNEYNDRKALIDKVTEAFRLNRANVSLPQWKRVSAAVGHASYNPKTDSGAESVMHRADAAMYENKKAMKEA